MFCGQCGKPTKGAAKFCGACGASIAAPDQPTPATAPSPTQEQRAPQAESSAPTIPPTPYRGANTPDQQDAGLKPVAWIGAIVGVVVIVAASIYFVSKSQPGKAAPLPTAAAAAPRPLGQPQPQLVKSATSDATPARICFDLSKHEPLVLQGTLQPAIFPEEPNYSDIRKGDAPVAGYVLHLNDSICAQGDEEGAANPTQRINEIQLYTRDSQTNASMRSLQGLKVQAELSSVEPQTNGHHHRPLVANVSAISPLDDIALHPIIARSQVPLTLTPDQAKNFAEEIGTPATTVRGFYYALNQGDGAAAQEMVIPEKRVAGPFAANSIHDFYGPLPGPVQIVDMKPRDSNEYLVTYTYATATRRCESDAVVKTTQRDGLNLVASVHTLVECRTALTAAR